MSARGAEARIRVVPERELDEVSLIRAQRGEASAFRQLVEVYQGRVFALVGRMLLEQPASVEDVAQDTFLKVHRALRRFDRRRYS